MKHILPSVRGARRIFHNGVRQVNYNGGRDFRVPFDGGRKGGAGARLSQSLREGNRRRFGGNLPGGKTKVSSVLPRTPSTRDRRELSLGCAHAKLRRILQQSCSCNDSEQRDEIARL